MENYWYGYVYTNGDLQVKRWFDDRDIEDARESPFVSRVFSKFTAYNREDALQHIRRLL